MFVSRYSRSNLRMNGTHYAISYFGAPLCPCLGGTIRQDEREIVVCTRFPISGAHQAVIGFEFSTQQQPEMRTVGKKKALRQPVIFDLDTHQ